MVVRAPLSFRPEQIHQGVEDNREWIAKQLKHMDQKEKEEKAFKESGLFIFRGREYPMVKIPGNQVYLQEGEIWIGEEGSLKDFYQKELEAKMLGLVPKWEKAGKPKALRYKLMKTRWGSCTHLGEVCLNLYLAKAPFGVLEYVYVHELVHIKVHNHSKKYWAFVEALLPDYRVPRKWLRENGSLLFL